MADLSSKNMRFKEFMLCRNAYWDLGEQIHAGGFCRLGAVPCALAHGGIRATSCLSAWLWSLEVPGDGDPSRAHIPWSAFWAKRASNTIIQCQLLQYLLASCCLDCRFLAWEHSSLVAPSSGTEGVLFPLTASMNRKLNAACVRAGTWAPMGFCPWEGVFSLNEQGGGRDEEENSTRCYSMPSLQLAARKDKWTVCALGIQLPQCISLPSRCAGFGLLSFQVSQSEAN